MRCIINGSVEFDSGVFVGPGDLESNFLGSILGTKCEPFLINGIYHSYKLPVIELEGISLLPLIYFTDGVVSEIQLHLYEDDDNKAWAHYSRQSQINKKDQIDNWLMKALGAPPYNYTWGEIETVYDQRGGSVFILLRYAQCKSTGAK